MQDFTAVARSVRVFLPDGTPNGLMITEIMNWNGKVLAAPRARLSDLIRRPEAAKTGIYLMTGPDPDRLDGVKVYIGEADSVGSRLRRHDGDEAMEFFNRVAVVVSSDENLTKAHVRVLESKLIRHATDAGRAWLVNETAPGFARLPEADLADMAFFADQLLLILPIVGFDLFRPAVSERPGQTDMSEKPQFEFDALDAHAQGRETDEGFVVLAGSTARKEVTPTLQVGYRIRRDQLLSDGKLADAAEPDRYVFTSDVMFPSPSAAASVVAGRSASGPQEWRVAGKGRTYKDWRLGQVGR